MPPNRRELGAIAAGKELQQQEGDEEKEEKVAAEGSINSVFVLQL